MSKYLVTVEPMGCGLEGLLIAGIAIVLILSAIVSAFVYVAQILMTYAIPLIGIGLFSVPFLGAALLGSWSLVKGWEETSKWVKVASTFLSIVGIALLLLVLLISLILGLTFNQSYSWVIWIVVAAGILATLFAISAIASSYALSKVKKCSNCGTRNPLTNRFCRACGVQI